MLILGIDPGFASAIQTMGGIFGPIIPPSVLMVLYAGAQTGWRLSVAM